jgi:uncharacterized membrane protein YraQ (UPF0718 family)
MFEYAFVDIVKDIGPWLILGIALAALVVVVAPVGEFVGAHLGGGGGVSLQPRLWLNYVYLCHR